MSTSWKYELNQMDIVSESNVSLAVKISLRHDAGLRVMSASYPALVPIYTRYHIVHLAFMDGFTNLDSSGAIKQGDRISVEEVLATAKLDLTNVWLPAILTLHIKTSARYKQILPKGMTPFNTKGVDARITAYDTLSKNIGVEAALAVIKGHVETTYNLLLTTREQQTDAKTSTSNTSGTLEVLRTAAMDMQYRDLGFIMDNFFDIRETLFSLVFDLVSIRSSKQVIFTGKLGAGGIKGVLAYTFVVTDTMSVKLPREAKLYLSNTIGGMTGTPITVLGNIKTLVNIADFGVTDYANFRYLTVVNQTTLPSSYSVTLL